MLAKELLSMLIQPQRKRETAAENAVLPVMTEHYAAGYEEATPPQRSLPTAEELSEIYERSSRRFDKHFELY